MAKMQSIYTETARLIHSIPKDSFVSEAFSYWKEELLLVVQIDANDERRKDFYYSNSIEFDSYQARSMEG